MFSLSVYCTAAPRLEPSQLGSNCLKFDTRRHLASTLWIIPYVLHYWDNLHFWVNLHPLANPHKGYYPRHTDTRHPFTAGWTETDVLRVNSSVSFPHARRSNTKFLDCDPSAQTTTLRSGLFTPYLWRSDLSSLWSVGLVYGGICLAVASYNDLEHRLDPRPRRFDFNVTN